MYINFYNSYFRFLKNNDNTTMLHRWCNNTSPIYKNTCNWEKKLENAQLDNCYSGLYNQKTNKY